MELDGSQHYEISGIEHDAERTAFLENFGFKVLRFSNNDVNLRFQSVCTAIDQAVKNRLSEGL